MAEVTADTVVDGRYRVLERIGSGGMAEVFAAEDTQLARRVALKVLHRRFAQDKDFVERFRREASSAAGLQHPNVVGVFDRGQHDGTYYIAMEHLPGRTLKELVTADAPLPQLRAIHLGLQLLHAAGFAHRRGVIHRDMKPHNAIVDEDDHLKVTDFGIARAGASEMTETGSIMGTAQYLSPEQAQGHAAGAQSDLYSIGVILYEMLAGELPFAGDSAVSVALKHLSQLPVPLRELRPDIHPALEAAVMRALEKDPSMRYPDAEAFIEELEAARDAIESGAPGGTAEFAPVVVEEVHEPPPEEERRRRWPWALLVLLLLALAAAVAYALTRPEEVAVPGVEGEQVAAATRTLTRAGFKVRVRQQQDPVRAGQVLDQDPEAREDADKGSTVTLTVSSGPGTRAIPPTRGDPENRAIQKLADAGFKVEGDSEREPSESVPAGRVIRTEPPAGLQKPIGSRVRLVISSGIPQAEVPDVVGLSREAAEELLTGRDLAPQVAFKESEESIDRVIDQSPDAGESVAEGARVVITVSTGPAQPDVDDTDDDSIDPQPTPRPDNTARVPDVEGQTGNEAARILRSSGFKVRFDGDRTSEVESQSPGGGSDLRRGGTVTLRMAPAQ